MSNVAVIGGGASGMMAAITAASHNCKVTIFEKNDRVGKKILSTGNGKCNFTNANLAADKYYCDDVDFINRAFEKFDNSDLIDFFRKLGMLSKLKNGYLYPLSEQASTVLDVLRNELQNYDVNILTESKVSSIVFKNDLFHVCIENDSKEYVFDKVIMACGGKSGLGKNDSNNAYDMLKKFGHKVTPLLPALTQIKCNNLNFPALKGVRCEADLTAFDNDGEIIRSNGELLFTEYGISGIVSFQLSHLVGAYLYDKRDIYLRVDLAPGLSEEDLITFFETKKLLNNELSIQDFMTGLLNKKLNVEIIKYCGFQPSTSVSNMTKEDFGHIVKAIKNLKLICCGINDFLSSQVTAGGIPLNEIDDSCQSVKVKGLYITGELLDVDGLCGGYNLQWAFTTGYIAGENVCY